MSQIYSREFQTNDPNCPILTLGVGNRLAEEQAHYQATIIQALIVQLPAFFPHESLTLQLLGMIDQRVT